MAGNNITTEESCTVQSDSNNVECSPESKEKKICEFYLQGLCRFGEECFNIHRGEVIVEDKSWKKHGNNNGSKRKEESDIIVEKKPPLRTAGDVRKRILWDASLPTEYFVIGYMDRFSGIIEEPFSAFSWEHLADAEIEDLSIPQHRIQYFKYKGTKVWDKELRLDHVFGSAGNDKNIEQVMREVDEELALVEPTFDDEEDDICVNDGTTVNPIAIRENQENQLRATHFLCVRIKSDGDIAAGVKQVQEGLIEGDSALAPCAMPSEILHLTLSMIKCETPESIDRVNEMLAEVEVNIKALPEYKPEGKYLQARGLSTFGARVLYAKMEVSPLFNKVVEVLHEKLKKLEDVVVTSHFEYVPHLTVLKVNRFVARERRSKYINSILYDEHLNKHFGTIEFDNIHFCIINDYRGLDQFYLTHSSIQF